MSSTVYWLSILDNIAITLRVIGGVLAAVYLIGVVACAAECYDEMDKIKAWLKKGKILLISSVIFVFISIFIPSRSDLIQAYTITEGAKVLDAESIKKLTEEIAKRVDHSINYKEGK